MVVVEAAPDPGWRVQGWSGTDNDPAAGSNAVTVTMDADKTVSVAFDSTIDDRYAASKPVRSGGGVRLP